MKFALVSGLGWCLDLCLTVALVQLGLSPFAGSLIGAAAAVSFVYAVSRLVLTDDRRIGSAQDFGLYVLWQIAAITAASGLVAALAHLLRPAFGGIGGIAAPADPLALASGVAKALVTPLTLLANFLFLRWLTGRGARGLALARRETR